MKFHTKRYDIRRVNGEDFIEGINYEIKLKNGYKFRNDSHLDGEILTIDYASDLDELKYLIANIIEW